MYNLISRSYKVIIYAYMNNICSCRKIEKLLLRDIHYIWLVGHEHPDFITINRFRHRVYDDIVRWKIAETELPRVILEIQFDKEDYPDIVAGEDVILDENGFVVVQSAGSRTFDAEKDYLYPLPLRECL